MCDNQCELDVDKLEKVLRGFATAIVRECSYYGVAYQGECEQDIQNIVEVFKEPGERLAVEEAAKVESFKAEVDKFVADAENFE